MKRDMTGSNSNPTTEELRWQFDTMEGSPLDVLNKDVNDISNELTKMGYHITAREFYNTYATALASSDKEESEAALRYLLDTASGDRLGYRRAGMKIMSDDSNTILFDIPSIYPQFMTDIPSDNTDEASLAIASKKFNQSQFANIPAQQERYMKDQFDMMVNKMKPSEAKVTYIRGWYEVFDFFGKLEADEAAQYQAFLDKQGRPDRRIYWAHELSLDEYIATYGRYGEQPSVDTKPSTDTTKDNSKEPLEEYNDTSDWE